MRSDFSSNIVQNSNNGIPIHDDQNRLQYSLYNGRFLPDIIIFFSNLSIVKHLINESINNGLPNPSRETKSSGSNADGEVIIFPVQLTTCRTGNLTRLIHTLAIYATIHYTVDPM